MAVDEKRSASAADKPAKSSPDFPTGEGEGKPASLLSGGAAAVVVLILLILLPIVYVLSIGPIVWLNDRQYINVDEGSVIMMFYAPLVYMHEHSPAAAAPLDWYVGLWESNSPPPYVGPTFSAPVPPANAIPVPTPYVNSAPVPGTAPGNGSPRPTPPAAMQPADETAPDAPPASVPAESIR